MLYVGQAADECNIPVRFYSLHSNPHRQDGKIYDAIKEAFIKQNFIALCLNYRQYYQAKDYYKISKYEILRNGVDFNNIRKNRISKTDARELYGLNDSDFVISCVGRLAPVKNFTFMLDIMKILVEKNKSAKLILAGDGPERETLENKANTLGLRNNVIFLGNIKQIIPVYCASDVFCVPSISEAASLVLLEAQAVDVFCVISAGVPEESIISEHVYQMKDNSNAKDWVDAIMNNSFRGKPVCTEAECDVNNATINLKSIYKKYYGEYNK